MSEGPPDRASEEDGASEEVAAAKLDLEAEAEARLDAEADTAAGLAPEAEGEL